MLNGASFLHLTQLVSPGFLVELLYLTVHSPLFFCKTVKIKSFLSRAVILVSGVHREKPLGARERTNNKLNPHMESTPGFEPAPHWWEASALTTAPPFLP